MSNDSLDDGVEDGMSGAGSSTNVGVGTDSSSTQRRKRRPRQRAGAVSAHEPAGAGAGAALDLIGSFASTGARAPAAGERLQSSSSADVGGGPSAKGKLYCAVCGDEALGYNYDCLACESCKTFFRRSAFQELKCSKGGSCEINVITRRNCSSCRFAKCLSAGMKSDYIVKDAMHGIGVPKREPPPRRARAHDGPKRAYRKRKLAWPPPLPADEHATEQPPWPREQHPSDASKRRVEPPKEARADVASASCAQLHGDSARNSSTYASASACACASSGGPPIGATTKLGRATSETNSSSRNNNSNSSSPRLTLVSLLDALDANADAFAAAPFAGSGFSSAESAHVLLPRLLAGSHTPSPQSQSTLPARAAWCPPFGADELLSGEQSSPASSRSISGSFYASNHMNANANVNVNAAWEQAAVSRDSPTNLAFRAPSSQCNIQTVQSLSPSLKPDLDLISQVQISRCRSQQSTPTPVVAPKRASSTATPPAPSNYNSSAFQFKLNAHEDAASRSQMLSVSPAIPALLPLAQNEPHQSAAYLSPHGYFSSPSSAAESAMGSSFSAEANDWERINQIRVQFDPRARQSADRTLVSHSLKVEPSPDPRFDLLITTESRCSSVARSITVSVPRMSPLEYVAMFNSLRAALRETRLPLSPEEAAILPRIQTTPYESFAYVEHALRKAIRALKLLPEFNALATNVQVEIVKAASSAIIRLLIAFYCDPEYMAFVYPVSQEYVNAGHPDDTVRINSVIDVVNIELSSGVVDTTAVIINSFNFAIGVHLHCGRDDLLMYMIVLLNMFSPHRYLADPHLLAAVSPLHARLLEFLKMYLENSSHQPLLTAADPLQAYQIQQYGQSPYPPISASQSQSQAPPSFEFPPSVQLTSNLQSPAHEVPSCTRLRFKCRPLASRITPDFEQCTMFGTFVPGMATLSNEQRELLKSLLVNSRICDQLDKRMLEQFGLSGPPKCPLAAAACSSSQDPYSPSQHEPEEDWRAEFAVCIAALNDVRMSEVTVRDYELRWGLSQQYSPLFNELLALAQPAPTAAPAGTD